MVCIFQIAGFELILKLEPDVSRTLKEDKELKSKVSDNPFTGRPPAKGEDVVHHLYLACYCKKNECNNG